MCVSVCVCKINIRSKSVLSVWPEHRLGNLELITQFPYLRRVGLKHALCLSASFCKMDIIMAWP